MRKLIIAALLLFAPTIASAESDPDWYQLPSDVDDGVEMYLRSADVDAGRSHQTDARLSIKYVMTKPKATVTATAMTRYSVNCSAQTIQELSHTYYLEDGQILSSEIPKKAEEAVPDSNVDVAIRLLCRDPAAS